MVCGAFEADSGRIIHRVSAGCVPRRPPRGRDRPETSRPGRLLVVPPDEDKAMNELVAGFGPEQEPINLALREHQVSASHWRFRGLLRELHAWAERFNVEFNLNTPVPAVTVKRLRGRCIGHFLSGRNSWGLSYEIAIDQSLAVGGATWLTLGVLLHECLHLWEEIHGSPPNSARFNYHSRGFRDKAHSLGLLVDRWGHMRYVTGSSPFLELLRKYGVEVPDLPPVEDQANAIQTSGASKLKLWVCECVPPVRVRVARRRFRARCLDCGRQFKRRD